MGYGRSALVCVSVLGGNVGSVRQGKIFIGGMQLLKSAPSGLPAVAVGARQVGQLALPLVELWGALSPNATLGKAFLRFLTTLKSKNT